jgi:hypothetical protein
MPKPAPILTAGSRAPRRPTRIPPAVRLACQYLVEGRPGDEGAAPRQLGFVEAARLAGMKPETMRRWLLEPAVRSLVKAKRAAVLESICAGNPLALAVVRDRSANDMAKVRAAVALEDMNNAIDVTRQPSGGGRAFQINIVNRLGPSPQPPAITIEARPAAAHRFPDRPPSPPMPEPFEPERVEQLQPVPSEPIRMRKPWG